MSVAEQLCYNVTIHDHWNGTGILLSLLACIHLVCNIKRSFVDHRSAATLIYDQYSFDTFCRRLIRLTQICQEFWWSREDLLSFCSRTMRLSSVVQYGYVMWCALTGTMLRRSLIEKTVSVYSGVIYELLLQDISTNALSKTASSVYWI